MEFQDLLYQNPSASGGQDGAGNTVPTSVEQGNGTKVASTSRVFTQGQLTQTGEEMDISIEGEGFLQIDNPDGTINYTRDGALKIGPDGQIVNSEGLPFTGLGTIPTETISVSISADGQFTFSLSDGTTQTGGSIQLARFPNPGGLKALGGNLFQETEASGTAELGTPAQNGYGTIHQGFLEMSNVNVVQEMVNMIIAQRAYEINSKAIQTSDEMLAQINQLSR